MSENSGETTHTQNIIQDNEENMNSLRIVHVHNQSKTYHLTRQVLLDSSITQNTHTFFYHILSMETDEFNSRYGSFAFLIERTFEEADLYLNVSETLLHHIVMFIQTNKIDLIAIYNDNWRTIDDLIDLATIFGMSVLIKDLRDVQPSEKIIENQLKFIKQCMISSICFLELGCKYLDTKEYIRTESCVETIDNFVKDNQQKIIDEIIKPNFHRKVPIYVFYLNTLLIKIITDYLTRSLFESNERSQRHFNSDEFKERTKKWYEEERNKQEQFHE
jgi:hypothetical protein